MAITVVQDKAGPSEVNGVPSTVAFPAALTAGNHLVFVFHSPSANDIPTPPAGLTAQATADDAGRPTVVYTRKIVAGDPQTWSMGTNNTTTSTSELHGYEIAGLDPSALMHASSTGVADTYTSMRPGPISTTHPDTIVFAAAGLGGTTGGSETIGDGFTDPAPGSVLHTRLVCGHRVLTVEVAALDPLLGWSNLRRANALQVALKGATVPTADDYRVHVMNTAGVLVPHVMIL